MGLTLKVKLSQQLLVGEILERNAFRYPKFESLLLNQRRITYEYLNKRVNQLAHSLLEVNVAKGDKVGILSRNRQEMIEIFFAAAKIGALSVPLNFRLSPNELSYIVDNSDCKILFFEDLFTETIENIRSDAKLVSEWVQIGQASNSDYKQYESMVNTGNSYKPEIDVQDDDEVFIIYTAGTTGRPKGALLTHKNFVSNSLEMIDASNQSQPRRSGLEPIPTKVLTVAPLFHVASILNVVRTMLEAKTIVLRDFEPEELLKTIESEKITNVFFVPTMWRILMGHASFSKYDVSSVRIAGYGADITPNSLKRQILDAFPNASLYEAFGQTEMSATTTYMKHQDALRKEGAVGLPLRMVSVRIVDHNMNDVPVHEVGEIVYRGPGMFKGYYNNQSETEIAFEGGWFHSGDLVKRDEEGFIYVVDRKKDMIVSGGENIYSAEVEEVLRMHPMIKEAAVVGVEDPKWGEAVKAFVVIEQGCKISEDEIIEACTKHLARFKKPKYIEFLSSLPRSATGKILKTKLRGQIKTN